MAFVPHTGVSFPGTDCGLISQDPMDHKITRDGFNHWNIDCTSLARQHVAAVELSDQSDTVSATYLNVKSREKETTELEANFVPNIKYSCEHCEYTTQTDIV